MTTLHVILAAPGLAGVRDVLQDWSALGHVVPFVWTRDAGEEALTVENGRVRRSSLRSAIASAQVDDAVITVLSHATPAAEVVSAQTVNAVDAALTESLGLGVPITRIRATGLVADAPPGLPLLGAAGWHNAVIAPEEAEGPNAGRVVLTSAAPNVDVSIHIAAQLAGLLGMWVGAERTAFAAADADPTSSARLVRSFYRKLDAAPVEAALRAAVLSTEHELPLPLVPGGAEYVEDVGLATETMARQYWTRHAGVLHSGREQPASTAASSIGAGAALRMFFGFLWAAIRNAPRSWLQGTMRRIRASAAGAVQSAVFGASDSTYRVVVRGVNPDGSSAGWNDFGEAVDEIAGRISDADSHRHAAHEDLTALWKDYAAASFTLADAGARVQGLPPVEIGAHKSVVRDRDAIVPGPGAAMDTLPQQLGAFISTAPIAPYDVLGDVDAERRLTQLAAQPGVGVTAGTALEELRQWRGRHRASFAVQVARPLAQAVDGVRAEIAGLLERLQQAGDDDLGEEQIRRQRALARLLRIIAVVALVVVLVVVVLLILSVIGLVAMLIAVGALVAGWMITSFVVFLRGQRDLFRLINTRSTLVAQLEADQKNLRHALRDARRLVDAYAQFQRWSEIIAAILAAPFGPRATAGVEDNADVSGLPPAVAFGTAVPSETALDVVSAQLRRGLFEPGWLASTWSAVIQNAHQRLGGRGVEFRDNPDLLFRQLGEGERTVLPRLRDDLIAEGVDPEVGDGIWREALRLLAEEAEYRPHAEQLLRAVRTPGRRSAISYEDFMDGADRAGVIAGNFDPTVLTPEGRVADRSRIQSSTPVIARDGLAVSVLTRQMSAGIPEYEFAAFDRGAGRRTSTTSGVSAEPDDFVM